MIIDAHTHSYTENGRTFTAQDLLASMDEAGIDYSLLIGDGLHEGGTTNEEVIQICEEHPRLKAIGYIEYKTLDNNQIQKVVDYLKEGKIHGVKLYPGYEDFYPLDEKLFPFYEQCIQLGKPVIFHTGLLHSGLPGRLKQSHPLNIDDLANKFPELKIVMAHFGNPWIIEGTMVVRKNKNVYVDLSGYFDEGPIPKEHIQFFTQDLAYFKGFVGDFKRCHLVVTGPRILRKNM